MLSKEFRRFIELLNLNKVRYLIVGGYAVALHGHPRYTKDLDVWIDLTPNNADNVLKALDAFGFGSIGLKTADFLQENQVVQLGYPPNRIDIVTTLTALRFEECYKTRVEVDLQGLEVNFIDIENLKKNKKATGRTQDLADIENLG